MKGMKRGYKNLFIFEIIIISILILNSFVLSILSGYLKLAFLLILLLSFYFVLGFEKDRHHLWKIVSSEIIMFLLLYFIIYYLSGLILSFTKTINYLTFQGIFKVIIPLILTIIAKEVLRYMMLLKAEGSKKLVILTCITFILFDLIGTYSIFTFKTPYNIFMFISLRLFPAISKNIVCTYISSKVGYKPVILYLLVYELYPYILPIVPNPNEYLYTVINFIVPFILLYRLYKLFKKDCDEELIRKYHKKKFGILILPIIVIIFLVYFTSGYFRYHTIVIASGSMVPNINKGDVVVIEKIEDNYDLLELNQVIAYKYNNIIVVHRLVKMVKIDNEYYYYTKGDANNAIDNYIITKDMIIGIVNYKIPYIGYPSVWLRNL